MARSVNKVFLLGNVGADPDVRFLPNGNPVCNLRIATSDSWTDKNTGQRQERTEWTSLVAFNKLAEIIQQYVHKGSKIYVEGKLQTRKWQAQDGTDRYTTEVVLNDLTLLDSAGGNGANERAANQAQSYPQSQYGQQQSQQPQQQQPQQQSPQQQAQQFQRPQQNAYAAQSGGTVHSPQQMPNTGDFDDSIPF